MTEPDLFGTKEKPAKKKAPLNPVAEEMMWYKGQFKEEVGEPYVETGADWPALKRLLAEFGREKLRERMTAYLKLNDPFIATEGRPIRLLPTVWNKITASLHREKSRIPDADRTQKYLDDLREHRQRNGR